MSHAYSVKQSEDICKTLNALQLRKVFSDAYREHLKAIIHQAVGVMLSCNGLSLDDAIVLYDKTRSKIEIIQSIINELPKPPGSAYFLSDSWYTSHKLIDNFAQKGFRTIGALRTNRIIYPNQTGRKPNNLLLVSARMIRMSAS